MKKLRYYFALMLALLFSSYQAHSQDGDADTEVKANTERKAYEEGDVSVNLGISFGLIGYGFNYYGNSSASLPISGNLDIGLSEHFSAGVYGGYLGIGYGPANNRYTFRAISAGIQGTLHATSLINEVLDADLNEEKIDYYARLMLGYEGYSWKYNGNSFESTYFDNTGGSMVFAPVLGVRYMFVPNIGLYLEGGRGAFGWFTLGVSARF